MAARTAQGAIMVYRYLARRGAGLSSTGNQHVDNKVATHSGATQLLTHPPRIPLPGALPENRSPCIVKAWGL